MPESRIVFFNGQPFAVAGDELPDPHPELAGGDCPWFDEATDAVCTTSVPHDGCLHIAHGGEGQVVALWDDEHGYQLPKEEATP